VWERERECVTDYTYSESIENVRIRKKERKKERKREKVTSGETVGMHKKEILTLSAAELFEASDVQQTELCV
jgi:hypothetical protein